MTTERCECWHPRHYHAVNGDCFGPKCPCTKYRRHRHKPVKSAFREWCKVCNMSRTYDGDRKGPWE